MNKYKRKNAGSIEQPGFSAGFNQILKILMERNSGA